MEEGSHAVELPTFAVSAPVVIAAASATPNGTRDNDRRERNDDEEEIAQGALRVLHVVQRQKGQDRTEAELLQVARCAANAGRAVEPPEAKRREQEEALAEQAGIVLPPPRNPRAARQLRSRVRGDAPTEVGIHDPMEGEQRRHDKHALHQPSSPAGALAIHQGRQRGGRADERHRLFREDPDQAHRQRQEPPIGEPAPRQGRREHEHQWIRRVGIVGREGEPVRRLHQDGGNRRSGQAISHGRRRDRHQRAGHRVGADLEPAPALL